jgi:cytoskeletal protein CcmA (bactofilin family)
MASVLALMLVGALISILILSSVIGAFAQTTQTRASVQSQAAAQAGIAAAVVGLQTASGAGSCTATGGVYESATAPQFRATIWYNGVRTCPTGSGIVKIISTGWAGSPGVAGASAGDEAYLEATFNISSSEASGSAVYVYQGGNVNAFTVNVADASTTGDIRVPNGNLACSTTSTISGNVIVANGTVNFSNSCHVTGSIRASGTISLSTSPVIDGDVVSSGGSVTVSNTGIVIGGSIYANGDVTLQGQVSGDVEATGSVKIIAGARVTGSVRAGGTVEIRGVVDGNVTTPGGASMPQSGARVGGNVTIGGTFSTLTGGARVNGSVSAAGTGTMQIFPDGDRIDGNLAIGGDLDSWNYDSNKPTSSSSTNAKIAWTMQNKGWIDGAITYLQIGLPIPTAPTPQAAPTAPAWVDWSYVPTDWVSAGYATTIVWPSNGCTIDGRIGTQAGQPEGVYELLQQIRNATTPVVVDARACTTLNFSNSASLDIGIRTNVAFIVKSVTLESTKFRSADGAAHKLYFLVQDGAPGTAGVQNPGGSCNIATNSAGVEIVAPIAAIAYTPCNISLSNGTKWRGQLYSNGLSVSSGDGVTYVPVGIPGTNLDGISGGASTGNLSPMTSLRNRSDDGE